MKKIGKLADSIMFDDIIKNISESQNISPEKSKKKLADMSFLEYISITEAGTSIVPPSGNKVGSQTKTTTPTQADKNIKAIWPGKGAPVEVGMTVGVKGPNGLPVPGQISQVDMSAKGVKIKNPTTGQQEWANIDTLEPYMVKDKNQPQTQTTSVNKDISRLQELAGIRENCSAGATGAGAIAISPVSMGKVKRRQPTKEEIKKEYTPKGPAKTVIGDTKPAQASGQLSATLAANGKKTASRTNNGFKK